MWERSDISLSWLSSGFQCILRSWEKANYWNRLSFSLAFQQRTRTPTLSLFPHSWNHSKRVEDFSVPGVSLSKTYIASTWSFIHQFRRGIYLPLPVEIQLLCSLVFPNKAYELEEFGKNALELKHTGMLCWWEEWVPLQSLKRKRFLSRELRLCCYQRR